jgi:DNA-binding transcriptional MerR regulator
MNALKIGDLADHTGTSAPTIRYYEQIGLLRPSRP